MSKKILGNKNLFIVYLQLKECSTPFHGRKTNASVEIRKVTYVTPFDAEAAATKHLSIIWTIFVANDVVTKIRCCYL